MRTMINEYSTNVHLADENVISPFTELLTICMQNYAQWKPTKRKGFNDYTSHLALDLNMAYKHVKKPDLFVPKVNQALEESLTPIQEYVNRIRTGTTVNNGEYLNGKVAHKQAYYQKNKKQ